jgi:hypothetical protein
VVLLITNGLTPKTHFLTHKKFFHSAPPISADWDSPRVCFMPEPASFDSQRATAESDSGPSTVEVAASSVSVIQSSYTFKLSDFAELICKVGERNISFGSREIWKNSPSEGLDKSMG